MLRLGYPQFTYSPEEGAQMAFNPELGEELEAQTSELLEFGDKVAAITDLSRENAPAIVRDISLVLGQSTKQTDGQRPFLEIQPGAYGGFLYRLSPSFRESLDAVMSDEARGKEAAKMTFEAMGRMRRPGSKDLSDLFVDRGDLFSFDFFGHRRFFNSGAYRLSIENGSIGDLYFGGDAGAHTIPSDSSMQEDVVRHYNTDHPYQTLGLLLGIGSLAHSAYRHSLSVDLATLLAYEEASKQS